MAKKIRYVILRVTPESTWEGCPDEEASSVRAALKAAGEANGEGRYVAIAPRCWKPKNVKVKTKSEITIE